MSEEKNDFVVRDKRIFSQENRQTDASEAENASTENEESASTSKQSRAKEAFSEAAKQASPTQLPQITFTTFIMSLNSSALVQLGLLADPLTGKTDKNLPVAKQTIDMLGMLEEKTKGNLTHEEEQLLKNLLYELRMLYVKAVS